MSRRTAGLMSPLLFTLVLLVSGGPALAGDLPSASGNTPYNQVSGEKPVGPEAFCLSERSPSPNPVPEGSSFPLTRCRIGR